VKALETVQRIFILIILLIKICSYEDRFEKLDILPQGKKSERTSIATGSIEKAGVLQKDLDRLGEWAEK